MAIKHICTSLTSVQCKNVKENHLVVLLAGYSRRSYGGYGVYSYGNCCQTLYIIKPIITPPIALLFCLLLAKISTFTHCSRSARI